MKFDIQKQEFPVPKDITKESIRLAEKFADKIVDEYDFVKAAFINRVSLRQQEEAKHLPIIVLIDDVSHHLPKTTIERYLNKVQKFISQISETLHVETMKFSKFWELTKQKEPKLLEILREAVILRDDGFVWPMKSLLAQGRIRPSRESTFTYFIRTTSTLKNSRAHIMQATLDLYWAVIDVGHAVLMKLGEIPPKPSHVANMLEERLVKPKKLDKKYPEILRNFYQLSRKILHKQIQEIKGEEFDTYLKEATDFITTMKRFLTYPV